MTKDIVENNEELGVKQLREDGNSMKSVATHKMAHES